MDEVMKLMVPKIAELCGKTAAEITPDTKLMEDLGMKSPTMVILISYLEDELEVDIDFMKFRRHQTVADAASYVAAQM